jgi:hypothetical protein
LAASHPNAFLPALAWTLSSLANWLSELGQHEVALQRAQEATEIRHQLTAAHPDAFHPYLAESLSIMPDCLENLEQNRVRAQLFRSGEHSR